MMKKTALMVSLNVLASLMHGAYAGALQPDAGSLQQQINPSGMPAKPSVSPDEFPSFHVNEIKDSTRFLVKSIRIIGNQDIDVLVLHGLVKDLVGAQLTMIDLQEACQRITDYYHAQGYSLARAIIPPQEIEDGRVTLQVIEARFGTIEIDNKSRVKTTLLESTMSGFKQGSSIKQYDLERALLLLTDIPGVQTSPILKAGKNNAESDLAIEVTPAAMLIGRVSLDDYGNRFINRPRLSANMNISNPVGYGDVISLNYLTTGERMQYARTSYDTLMNGAGTRIGGAYTHLHYLLGGDIKSLDANGTANTYELYLRHPLRRTRMNNVFLNLQYVDNHLKDHIDAASIKIDREVKSTVFSVNGDQHDDFLGGGVNSYSLAYTMGNVDFTNAAAALADALSKDTAGHFSKWVFNLNRLQAVNDKTQVWMSITTQQSQHNLDSSQKMTFGGPYSVRAYDNGTVSGDNGTLLNVELRRFLTDFHGKIQGVLFADSAHVEVNNHRWAGNTGINKAKLHGAGFGVQWQGAQDVFAKLSAASTIGGTNSLTDSGDKRLIWFEIAQYF